MNTTRPVTEGVRSLQLLLAVCSTVLFMSSSCLISIHGRGPGNDYKFITEAERKQIIFVEREEGICDLPHDSSKIFAVTGTQLKECLKNNDTSVVYMWSPNCPGESCILISACQKYCDENNYKLYVVADYYDMKVMNAQNVAVEPILIPNHFYYEKDFFNRIKKLFRADLLGREPSKEETGWCRFMLFKGDQLIEYRSNLYDM